MTALISVRAATLRWVLAAAVCVCAYAACAPQRPPPPKKPARSPVAVSAALVLTPLDVSPDGEARLLVRVRYRDADGRPVRIPSGGHVDVVASRGEVQWQPRARYGGPAAIVRLTEAGPLSLRVDSDLPRLPHRLSADTDTHAWRLAPVTARALGPHAVVVGWFPRVHEGTLTIVRTAPDGTHLEFAVPAPASSFRDTSVSAGAQYTYAIGRPDHGPIDVGVGVPAELPTSTPDVLRGKAMWLAFDDDVSRWNVDEMLARARAAGLSAVELRLCYGEYDEITPARRAIVDRFIDGAAASGIAIVGWTVPRAVSFEDLAAAVAAAGYRTAAGNGVRGLAVDLERGDDFLGTGEAGRAALATYLARLREAVGSRVLLVATVEDPVLEHLSTDDVPYGSIAQDADVLQPMVYWRVRRPGASIDGMRAQLRASYGRLRELAGDAVPIDIGGQTAGLDKTLGPPPPAEVAASLTAAAGLGALGEAFFDWNATTDAQWKAIGATPFVPQTPEPRPSPD